MRKLCGEYVLKGLVNAIFWATRRLSSLGEPALMIDVDKPIDWRDVRAPLPDTCSQGEELA